MKCSLGLAYKRRLIIGIYKKKCVCVLSCKQQQCKTWIHFPYLHRILVWDFHGYAVMMYVQTM